MHAAIFSLIEESGFISKMMARRMFKNENSFGQKDVFFQYSLRKCRQVLKIIGGIGKYHIVLLPANVEEAKNIHSYRVDFRHIKFAGHLSDKPDGSAVDLNQVNLPATPGVAFHADASCTAKKVEESNL